MQICDQQASFTHVLAHVFTHVGFVTQLLVLCTAYALLL